MFSLSLHSKSDRFFSSEYLSHDLDGSSKQSYSIFLKNLFIGTHRGPTWLSFLQLSPFELFETVARRVRSQFVALECKHILCNIVSYKRRNYFLPPLDPSEMQIGKRYGTT